MLGIIGGSTFLEAPFFDGLKEKKVKTDFGTVSLLVGKGIVFLPRHGKKGNIPPHKVNHPANLSALKSLGCDKVIGVSSTGSLKQEIRPGSLVLPHDYISLWQPATVFENKKVHITPGLSEKLRKSIARAANDLGITVIERAVYVQTIGPRLETKAEIAFLKQFADLVGMTMASEATIAKELEMEYASISSVDNYANGAVEGTELSNEKIALMQRKSAEVIKKILAKLIEELSW